LNRGGRSGRGAYWDGQGEYLVWLPFLTLLQDIGRVSASKSLQSRKRFVVTLFFPLSGDAHELIMKPVWDHHCDLALIRLTCHALSYSALVANDHLFSKALMKNRK